MKNILLGLLLITSLSTIAQSSVRIGSQEWSTMNLDVLVFKNGDSIPFVDNSEDWRSAGFHKKPACCFFKDDSKNAKYGILYNWYAISDPRGLVPDGWRIPSKDDWQMLINQVGKEMGGSKLKSKDGWIQDGNGTNDYGFNALPVCKRYLDGYFEKIGKKTSWWSSSLLNDNYAEVIGLNFEFDKVSSFERSSVSSGHFVRLVRDKVYELSEMSSEQEKLISNYPHTKIGGRVWMTKNLNKLSFNNGDAIEIVKSEEEWINALNDEIPVACYFLYDSRNGDKYGVLYNYWAIKDERGLAPKGWRICTQSDVTSLVDEFGGELNAGHALRSTSGWEEPFYEKGTEKFYYDTGTNKSGFNGFPGGSNSYGSMFKYREKNSGVWWMISKPQIAAVHTFRLASGESRVFYGSNGKSDGCYVRCVKIEE